MPGAAVFGERALKVLDLRSQNETLGLDDLVELLPDRLRQQPVLFAQVEQRHAHPLPKHEWRTLARGVERNTLFRSLTAESQ